MNKTVPTFGRLAVMTGFALSCFGLLLYLWLAFGGSMPLKPKGYRFQAAFPEATQLSVEAPVRIAGVEVGKVRATERDPRGGRTLATMELDREYAPIPADAKAMLRQKTLLGETYVELTPGTTSGPKVPEGGRLEDARVRRTVEFDEILSAFDPETRKAFQAWQQDQGAGVVRRGADLNDAIGALPGLFEDGADTLEVLRRERGALARLVRDSGTIFEALTEREDKLRQLVVNTQQTFDETAEHNEDLAEAISIFPTFLAESRKTFERTERFAASAGPVVRQLRAPVRDLGPTFTDLQGLAPDLVTGFRGLDRLRVESREGLPAAAQVLDGLRPFLAELDPFLGELTPILQFLEVNQLQLADFLGGQGAVGLAPTTTTRVPGAAGHYLRQVNPTGPESIAIYRDRTATNRGNAYINRTDLTGPELAASDIFPNFDCVPSGGETKADDQGQAQDGDARSPGCFVQRPFEFQGRSQRFPRVGPHSTR